MESDEARSRSPHRRALMPKPKAKPKAKESAAKPTPSTDKPKAASKQKAASNSRAAAAAKPRAAKGVSGLPAAGKGAQSSGVTNGDVEVWAGKPVWPTGPPDAAATWGK